MNQHGRCYCLSMHIKYFVHDRVDKVSVKKNKIHLICSVHDVLMQKLLMLLKIMLIFDGVVEIDMVS